MSNPTPIIWYNAAGERYCVQCGYYMPREQFHRNRSSSAGDGLQRHCRVCSRTLRHAAYERARERETAYARAWQAAHPEQVRATRRRAQRVYHRLHRVRRPAPGVPSLGERAQAARLARARTEDVALVRQAVTALRAEDEIITRAAVARRLGWCQQKARRVMRLAGIEPDAVVVVGGQVVARDGRAGQQQQQQQREEQAG